MSFESSGSNDKPTKNTSVNLGYACVCNSITYPKGRKGITCKISSVYQAGEKSGESPGTPEYSAAACKLLINYGHKNTQDIMDILKWHIKHNMRFYRMSSDLFPHIDNEMLQNYLTPEDLNDYRNLVPFRKNIELIADLAYKNKVRLTMHPDQYAVLGSPDADKVKNTVRTLEWHALFIQIMEDYIRTTYNVENAFIDSILCLHIGGKYDSLSKTFSRWGKAFRELPEYVQKRLCLENCEKNASAEELLPLCEELNIPLILDFHHYVCYNHYHKGMTQESIDVLLPRIMETWRRRGMKPKFHLSDQDPQKSCIGAHDEFVMEIPKQLLEMHQQGMSFDIMIEAKSKDFAVFYLLSKYPHMNNTNIINPYSLIPSNYPRRPVLPVPFSGLIKPVDSIGALNVKGNNEKKIPKYHLKVILPPVPIKKNPK